MSEEYKVSVKSFTKFDEALKAYPEISTHLSAKDIAVLPMNIDLPAINLEQYRAGIETKPAIVKTVPKM